MTKKTGPDYFITTLAGLPMIRISTDRDTIRKKNREVHPLDVDIES